MSFGAARLATEKAVFRPALPMSVLPGLNGTDMSEKIGAIETTYAGHKFRSRLEARWAVFFDAVGVKWKYEPQGFQSTSRKYLPDFYLPEFGHWVEVKGSADAMATDAKKVSAVLMSGAVPNFLGSEETGDTGLILLHDIPSDSSAGLPLFPVLRHSHRNGITRGWSFFMQVDGEMGFGTDRHGPLMAMLLVKRVVKNMELDPNSDAWDPSSALLPTVWTCPVAREAFTKARMARFEHGARG